jgi:hypothetical protein
MYWLALSSAALEKNPSNEESFPIAQINQASSV